MKMGRASKAAGGRHRDPRFQEQQRRFERSGKTATAFCKDEGVALSTFYQRRARVKKQGQRREGGVAKRTATFIDAGALVVAPAVRAMMGSQSARESDARVEVRIDLGGGVVLHVSRR
jgi:hypothetical protein